MKRLVVSVTAAFCLVSQASADLTDDFQDGDTTNDPIWFVSNPPGSDEVRSDADDPSNLVLAMHGTNAAHHRLATVVSTQWEGFQFSVDFRSDGVHNTDFQLLTNLPNDTPPSLAIRWTRSTETSSLELRNGGDAIAILVFDLDASDEWVTLRPCLTAPIV